MAGHWPRFFAFWLTLTSSRSYPVWKRLFMRVFGQVKREKHALLISVMAGYWPSFFFFSRFHGPRHPGYQRFILACDYELRRPQAEDTSGEAARKNLWYPGYLGRGNAKNNVANIQPSRLSWTHAFRAGHFLRLDRNRKPRVKSLWSRVGQDQDEVKVNQNAKKSEANIQPSRLVNNACFNFVSHF